MNTVRSIAESSLITGVPRILNNVVKIWMFQEPFLNQQWRDEIADKFVTSIVPFINSLGMKDGHINRGFIAECWTSKLLYHVLTSVKAMQRGTEYSGLKRRRHYLHDVDHLILRLQEYTQEFVDSITMEVPEIGDVISSRLYEIAVYEEKVEAES